MLAWFLLLLVHSIPAAAYTQLCRCNCGANYTVLSVPVCTNCTRQFCIKSVGICQKDWVTLDQVTTSCFQRESFKDKFFIYSFILVTSCLLIYASVQHYAADWANRVSHRSIILRQPILTSLAIPWQKPTSFYISINLMHFFQSLFQTRVGV